MTFIEDSPLGLVICSALLALGFWLLAKGGDYLVSGGLGLANVSYGEDFVEDGPRVSFIKKLNPQSVSAAPIRKLA